MIDVSKPPKQPRWRLIRGLCADGAIYRRANRSGYRGYEGKVRGGLITHKLINIPRSDGTEQAVTQVLITPKGVARLAELFSPQLLMAV